MNAITARASLWMALALFAATGLVLVLLRPLLPIDETRYLTVAWEMWQGGSKIVPHLNGEIYSHKPPMLFWLVNLVWAVTGVSEIAARLVAPAFGLISVALTALLARRLWPEDKGRADLAALILASGMFFALYGSATMFDTMLTAATLAAMLALMAMRANPGLWPTVGLGAALAFGVLAKGPVILVHVLPVALLLPVWADTATRPGLAAWYRGLGAAVLVAVALVGLWLGPALVMGGAEYRADVLWRQSAGRMVESFAHDRPFWFFLALLPVFAWPWGWSRAAWTALSPRRLWADEPARLLVVWAVTALLAFSLISGKQAHYLIPEMPALALLLSGMAVGAPTLWRKVVLVVPVLAVALVDVLTLFGYFPQLLVNGAAVSLPMLGLTCLVAVGLVGLVWRIRTPLLATALAAPLTLLAMHVSLQEPLRAGFGPDPIAQALAPAEAAGLATTDKNYAGQFTFSARLKGPVAVLDDPAALTAWIATHPGGIIFARADLADPGLTLLERRDFQGKPYRLYSVAKGQP
jgi:4-amino-4-deoxy-L-arabinose transferase-like glycosyltransferase